MEKFSAAKVREIFNSMDYGENLENTRKGEEWLQTVEIRDKSAEVDSFLKFFAPTKQRVRSRERQTQLISLAKEIEKNEDIFTQIEILSRGVLSKDTKKSLDLLADYFYCCSNFLTIIDDIIVYPNVVAICDDENPLWMLGAILAPALGTGCRILLQTGTKLAVTVTFLLQLARKAGFTEEDLALVPSNEGNLQSYLLNENVNVVVLFVDLLEPKYQVTNPLHKKLLILSSYNTPMIVFDNADTDSAVESVIDAAWGHQGMLPWSVNIILIQESIFTTFVSKLKDKLSAIKIGNGNDKMADISYPTDPSVYIEQTKTVRSAKMQGIEVYQKDESSGNFTPTLLIGMKTGTNHAIKEQKKDGCVTLLAFRSIDEAVNLANNSRQGIGASVWTENIGLANEVARKLEVNNVWINSHGLMSVEVPLAPLKDSGVGYFGGEAGFYEYVLNSWNKVENIQSSERINEAVTNAISCGKKASVSWSKCSPMDRLITLREGLEHLQIRSNLVTQNTPCTFIDALIYEINSCTSARNRSVVFTYPEHNVMSVRTARGVLALELNENFKFNAKVVVSSIMEGNAIVVLNLNPVFDDIYEEISRVLPSGLLSVFPCSDEARKACVSHRQLDRYFSNGTGNSIFGNVPIKESKMFEFLYEEENRMDNFVRLKNIWSNVGHSTTFKY